jgi:uncharacterized protein YkwD
MRSARSSKFARRTAILAVAAVAITLAGPVLRASASQASDEASSRSLVNQARTSAGLASLAPSAGLDKVARAQAARMADRDAIYHNENLKAEADAAGVNWQLIGENVGVGPDVQAVHNAFMSSPGHKSNVVYKTYNAIGVGIVTGKDGSIFVAHVFAEIPPAATQPSVAASPQAAAPKAVVAPIPSQPAPAPEPVEVPSADPNAVVGGIVVR